MTADKDSPFIRTVEEFAHCTERPKHPPLPDVVRPRGGFQTRFIVFLLTVVESDKTLHETCILVENKSNL